MPTTPISAEKVAEAAIKYQGLSFDEIVDSIADTRTSLKSASAGPFACDDPTSDDAGQIKSAQDARRFIMAGLVAISETIDAIFPARK